MYKTSPVQRGCCVSVTTENLLIASHSQFGALWSCLRICYKLDQRTTGGNNLREYTARIDLNVQWKLLVSL